MSATLQCGICDETFKGPQGLGSHMRWHRKEDGNTPKRRLGSFQEQFLHVLGQHPHGLSCKNIAIQLQKDGYKSDDKTEVVAARVSSVATATNMRSRIVRTGRGFYRLKASERRATHTLPIKQPTIQTKGLPTPTLPSEALHLRIEHLERENDRLRRAMTMQNQTMQVLVTGDLIG